MSKIVSGKEKRIRERIDRIFGDSPAGAELKAIALKAALDELTEEDAREYWRNKEEEIRELKERMPETDLALPSESVAIVGQPLLSNIIMGEIDNGLSGEGEINRDKSSAIIDKVE